MQSRRPQVYDTKAKMSSSVLLLTLFYLSARSAECAYKTKAIFPASSSNYPRLRLTNSLPSLKEFTLCAWTRHDVINGVAASIISYAVYDNDNEFSLYSYRRIDDILVRLHVGKKLADFNCTGVYGNLGSWQHICATWFWPDGSSNVYINGQSCGNPKKVPSSQPLRGGGIAVIGQEQDALGGKFDSNQAWVGDIAELHMWDEVLNDEAIWEAGKCDENWTNGNVISWLKTPMTADDGVVLSETQLCKY